MQILLSIGNLTQMLNDSHGFTCPKAQVVRDPFHVADKTIANRSTLPNLSSLFDRRSLPNEIFWAHC